MPMALLIPIINYLYMFLVLPLLFFFSKNKMVILKLELLTSNLK